MQTSNRFLDDLAKVANGAATTLSGIKDEIDQQVRQRIERFLVDADLVPREEFEAVREMAATARQEQEKLVARVAELEGRLAALEKSGSAGKRAAGRKTAARKKTAKKSGAKRRAGGAGGAGTG